MSLGVANIVYEDGNYWVSPAKCGFEVWRVAGTHSVRCAVIGFNGEEGIRRAVAEIARRKALEAAPSLPSAPALGIREAWALLREMRDLFDERGYLFCSGDYQLEVIAKVDTAISLAPREPKP